MIKKLDISQRYDSMRGWFGYELFNLMADDPDIYVITGDLGYGLFDKIRTAFPNRFINAGAAEQVACGLAVGLALEGKKPFFYSMTPFLLYRCLETIRNYIHHEKIPVRLVGSGRDKEYHKDGFSHWAEEDKKIMQIFKNITCVWPEDKQEIPKLIKKMVRSNKPWYINLSRY